MLARPSIVVCGALLLASCSNPLVSPTSILEHEAEWTARKPANYLVDVSVEMSVLIPACPSAKWQLEVRNGVAVGATCIATSQYVPGQMQTIDSVFTYALRAEANGTLARIEFDPTYGFPSLLAIGGPPDAGWSEQLSNLQPLQPASSIVTQP